MNSSRFNLLQQLSRRLSRDQPAGQQAGQQADQFGTEPIIPVRVDLIGDQPAAGGHTPASPGSSTNPFAPRPPRSSGSGQGDGATQASAATAENGRLVTATPTTLTRADDWQFNKTVLLRKSPRTSSVIVWTAVGGLSAVLAWAILAPLGEAIPVQGKLVPSSRVKTVQAVVSGVVADVLVTEGQTVQEGDLLLRFDLRQATAQLQANEAIRDRLLNENQINTAVVGDGVPTANLTPNQRQQLLSQASEVASKRETVQQQLRQSEVRLQGLRSTLATASSIAERFEGLAESGAVSELQVLDSRNKAQEIQTEVLATEREIAALRSSLENTTSGSDLQLRSRIEENLRAISDLNRQIREARLLIENSEVRAPASGTIFDLQAVVGKVVSGSEPLLRVVPPDSLEAKIFIPNRAIGYVTIGQSADISLETYPSNEYGAIPATIARVSTDSLTPEQMQQELGSSSEGLVYPAVLKLERQTLPNTTIPIPLKAGMTLTADIQLRERSVISIFTSFLEDRRQNLERMR